MQINLGRDHVQEVNLHRHVQPTALPPKPRRDSRQPRRNRDDRRPIRQLLRVETHADRPNATPSVYHRHTSATKNLNPNPSKDYTGTPSIAAYSATNSTERAAYQSSRQLKPRPTHPAPECASRPSRPIRRRPRPPRRKPSIAHVDPSVGRVDLCCRVDSGWVGSTG